MHSTFSILVQFSMWQWLGRSPEMRLEQLPYMAHRCSNSRIHLYYVLIHGAGDQQARSHLYFTHTYTHRLSSNPMSWMGRCVMNVMVCSAMGNLLPSSVAVWRVFSTFVSTVGPLSTPFLADRTTDPWWKTSVLIEQGLTSSDAITVNSTCIQLPYQLFQCYGHIITFLFIFLYMDIYIYAGIHQIDFFSNANSLCTSLLAQLSLILTLNFMSLYLS